MHKKYPLLAVIVGLTVLLLWLSTKSWAEPRQYWKFPLTPRPEIARGFDPPARNWLPGHRGVDLQAHSGQTVLAPANGTIAFVSQLAGRGVVVIKHGRLRSTYEPVVSHLTIGTAVARGDKIGQLRCGMSHCCHGTQVKCLHWGLLRGSQYLNPLGKVDIHIRLLPIEPVLPRVPIIKRFEITSGGEMQLSASDNSARVTDYIRRTRPVDAPAQKPNATDPSKRAYKVAWLPNWHGQGFLAPL